MKVCAAIGEFDFDGTPRHSFIHECKFNLSLNSKFRYSGINTEKEDDRIKG